jgi:NADH-quinone oxidoreductase subunit G
MAVGPIPVSGEDKTFPGGFKLYAEKAPNARGVRRVLAKIRDQTSATMEYAAYLDALKKDASIDTVVLTGNYPSDWVTTDVLNAIDAVPGRFVILIDTLQTKLVDRADVVLPGATWTEKAGVFENANNRLQAFDRAIEPIDYCKGESQIAMDLSAIARNESPTAFNAESVRRAMARTHGLTEFVEEVHYPPVEKELEPDMEFVTL